MRILHRVLGVTAIISMIVACSPSTKVTGSWTRVDHEPASYKKIVVLGIAPNSTNRRIFEDHVETRLKQAGYPVIAALDMLPPNAAIGTITRDIVLEIFTTSNVDAVFTMSVRHMEDTRRYVPGSSYYTPYYYNVPFYDYYGGFSNYYYSPGYYTGSLQIYLESNFFDLNTGELIWSAQTKTTDLSNIEKMAIEFADVIVADFIRQDVLKKPVN
ncbi:MAG TPA: hypothetical protein VK994_01195 [Bacteroidales bacterium]|nr:hypothetical protein [Bacteroidales bacterium]